MESTEPNATGAAANDSPAAAGPEARLAALEAELKAARDESLRLLAEMDNQRKRLQRDVEAARKYGTERLLGDLLPVCDGLEAGLKAEAADAARLREGTAMTLRMLQKALESHGLSAIDPAGEPFDPARHQAVSVVDTGQHTPDTVVTVFQKGYALADRLLRPALVAVAKEPSGSGA